MTFQGGGVLARLSRSYPPNVPLFSAAGGGRKKWAVGGKFGGGNEISLRANTFLAEKFLVDHHWVATNLTSFRTNFRFASLQAEPPPHWNLLRRIFLEIFLRKIPEFS